MINPIKALNKLADSRDRANEMLGKNTAILYKQVHDVKK